MAALPGRPAPGPLVPAKGPRSRTSRALTHLKPPIWARLGRFWAGFPDESPRTRTSDRFRDQLPRHGSVSTDFWQKVGEFGTVQRLAGRPARGGLRAVDGGADCACPDPELGGHD